MTYLIDSLDTPPVAGYNGRLVVSYDRYGFKIQRWEELDEPAEHEEPLLYSEYWFSFSEVRFKARANRGNLKSRLVQAASDLVMERGYANPTGEVPDTQTVIDDYGNQRHW